MKLNVHKQRGKHRGDDFLTSLYISHAEAIRLIESLAYQISLNNPNGSRREDTIEADILGLSGTSYFSIIVNPENKK